MAIVLTVLAAVILLMVHYSRDFLVMDIHSKREILSHRSNTPDEVNTGLEIHKSHKGLVTKLASTVKVKQPKSTKHIRELPVHSDMPKIIPKTSSHRSNTPDEVKTKSELQKSRTVATDKVKQPTHTKMRELPVHTLESMYKNCSDTLCLKYLSDEERGYFDECTQRANSLVKKYGPITNSGQCRFQNGTNRVPVALASFPGSGNTWVRGLLEKVTGFCTGNH